MTDVTISSMIGNIEKYKFNPVMIQRTALEALRMASNDTVNIVDPTNPFVFCLENTATNTAAFMQQNEASTRRLYVTSALTEEDLYLHMSDKDYIGRFATPSSAIFTVMLSKDELLSKLILDIVTGIRKITIPKNTVFSVAGIPFSLQYAIDIRVLSHGGMQIVYNVDEVSPLLTLTTNSIDWDQVSDPNGLEFIRFSVEATQFDIITSYNDVSAASGFKTDIAITDSFYYVRCYVQNSLGVYQEIQTTHTQQIYDPFTPTAVITVLGNKVRVVIPVIYTTTNLIKGKLRIDVYQTKGELDLLLGNYQLEDFSANWLNIDKKDDTVYVAPIRAFKTLGVYSITHVSGGRNSLSFETLRTRVIKNAIGSPSLPITNIQLETDLEDNGYEVVRNIDTITNRIYLATRNLPKPIDERIVTAASASMSEVTLSLTDAVKCYGVIDNGESVTLTSKTVYKNTNGITKPLTKLEFNQLNNSPLVQKCNTVTNGNYLFSPFHYVLDSSGDTFEVRPYYLDGPKIESKSFVEENVTTGLQVSIDSAYSIVKIDTGYKLTIITKSSQGFKDIDNSKIFVQLAFNYKNDDTKSYLLGNFLGLTQTNERIYEFNIDSSFDVDAYDYLNVKSFKYVSTSVIVKAKLLQEMDIYFSTIAPMPASLVASRIDDELGRFQLPAHAVGITHEKIKVRFGYALKNLWAMSKSMVDSIEYRVYQTDIPAIYTKDVYDIDPISGSAFTTDANGNLKYKILHKKGDNVLDVHNNKVYAHRKGENVYDVNGLPVPIDESNRTMLRLINMLMIEGAYYFATDSIVTDYNKSIVDSLLNWITVDLVKFNSTLLDQTKLYFFPKVTLGDIKVLTLNGVEITTQAGQSLRVKLHVPAVTYSDSNLLNAITKTTIKSIDDSLKNKTVSVSAIEHALINVYGKDVINVEVQGIGGQAGYQAFTILDNSNRCSIKKKLSLLPDNKMVVTEDIEVVFIKHDIGI